MKRILIAVLLIELFFCLIGLGFWQLHRAAEKETLLKNRAQAERAQPVLLTSQTQVDTLKPFQKIKVQGSFQPKKQLLLDNKFYEHQLGYEVLTPFKIAGTDRLVLINRGWIPRGKSRATLPQWETPTGPVTLVGQIYFPKKTLLQLGNPATQTDWPRVVETQALKPIQKTLGAPIFPFLLRLDPTQPHGFKRHWVITTIRPARHRAYAFQWFTMAAVLLLLSLWTIYKARYNKTDKTDHPNR